MKGIIIMPSTNNWGGMSLVADSPLTEQNINRVFSRLPETNNMNSETTLENVNQIELIAKSFEVGSTFSITNLTEAQKYIIQRLIKDGGKDLIGKEFQLISTMAGFLPTKSLKGVLTNISATGRLAAMSFKLHLEDNSIYLAYIFQLEPLFKWKLQKPTAKELADYKKNQTNKVILSAIDMLNKQINYSIRDVKSALDSRRGDVESYKNAMLTQAKEVERLEELLSKKEVKNLTLKDIEAELAAIKRNQKVADAYISTQGHLIVITKMLYALDTTGKENKKIEIGRFVFNTPLTGKNVRAFGLDYVAEDEHSHPNLRGSSICWGENATELKSISDSGQLYELVDLLIIFFSLYPHDGGSPYIDFDSWLEERERATMKTGWLRDYIRDYLETPLLGSSVLYEQLMKERDEAQIELLSKSATEHKIDELNQYNTVNPQTAQTVRAQMETGRNSMFITPLRLNPLGARPATSDEEDED